MDEDIPIPDSGPGTGSSWIGDLFDIAKNGLSRAVDAEIAQKYQPTNQYDVQYAKGATDNVIQRGQPANTGVVLNKDSLILGVAIIAVVALMARKW